MFRNEQSKDEIETYNFGSEEEEILEDEEFIIITALFQAIEDQNINIIEDLFSTYSIDINKPNFECNNGELALHVACGIGNTFIVKILIENGANVNLIDSHGDTAIHWAASQDNALIIRLLYEHGADVNIQNKSGESGIHIAARQDYVDTTKQLCKCGANVNLVDEHGETALHIAVWHDFPRIVDVLGEVGINTDVKNKEEETALHCAAARGHIDCVRCLLEIGVNLNILDKNGCTALHLALRRYHFEIAIFLIKYKCNIEVKDVNGETALHLACRTGQKKVVDQLCKFGCNLNCKNIHGETPLHLAVKSSRLEIIRRLCTAGCDQFIENSSGIIPKDLLTNQSFDLIKEDPIKNEILTIMTTLTDPIVQCKLIGMLKPVTLYYDKNFLAEKFNKTPKSYCPICFSLIDNSKKISSKCCNMMKQCVNQNSLNDKLFACCNNYSGINKSLDDFFKSNENINNTKIPSNLLKFNLKVLGNCASGKTTLIETLKCGYLASWFRKSTKVSTEKASYLSSLSSLSSNQSNNLARNSTSALNESSSRGVLSSISTLTSSKSSLNSSNQNLSPTCNIFQSNSAINSIGCSSIQSINSDFTNIHSSNFNFNNKRKNSAINSEICNLKNLSKEFSVSDGLHPEIELKQDLNKFFASFHVLDSKFGLNHVNSNLNHNNHKVDCTLGINVQQVNVPNVGDLTVWDFSGHPNYLQIYNKFLNDKDDAFYIICFDACESFDKQYTQVCYWLDLIKSVVRINCPLNFKGYIKKKIQVLVIATHRDLAIKKTYYENSNLDKEILLILDKLKLKLTNNISDNLNVLHVLLKLKYEQIFDLNDLIYFLDTRLTSSNEIKIIKQHLENYKNSFAVSLKVITVFLENVISKLSILRKSSYNSPIVSYNEFVSLLREQINILVEDEYLEFICLQLEKLGEIICLKNNHLDFQDLVIYDIKWLLNDIIGNLLNSSYFINNGKITGHYSVEDLQSLFPDIDALDLILILETLELCTSCETEGNFLYLFPCFIKIGRPEITWNSDEQLDENKEKNYTYIGLRLQNDDYFYPKHLLVCLFPRIQILFERCFQQTSFIQQDINDLKLIHWCNGLRISFNDLEAIICLGLLESALEFDSIEIKVRSYEENKEDCFKLFELLVNLVEQYINSAFPCLNLQRSYYSPYEMNNKKKLLYRYSNEELVKVLLDDENLKTSCLQKLIDNENYLKETLSDIICCGLNDIEKLNFKTDNFLVNIMKEYFELFLINSLPVYEKNDNQNDLDKETNEKENYKVTFFNNFNVLDLNVLIRQQLCKLLDPPETMGKDWCMLSVKLNLTEKLPILDSNKKPFISPTWRLLDEYSKENDSSIKNLIRKLTELNRQDAIDVIYKSLPLIKIFSNKNDKIKPLLSYNTTL